MHGCGNAGLFEFFLQGFAVRNLNGVLGPGAGVLGFQIGCSDRGHGLSRFARNDGGRAPNGGVEESVVGVSYALTLNQFFVQHGQFGQEDGRL